MDVAYKWHFSADFFESSLTSIQKAGNKATGHNTHKLECLPDRYGLVFLQVQTNDGNCILVQLNKYNPVRC